MIMVFQGMSKNKKIILLSAIGILILLIAITIPATLSIMSSKKTQSVDKSLIKKQADDLAAQAMAAEKNGNQAKSITLLIEANSKYVEVGNTTGDVNTEAKLCIAGQAIYCKHTD